MATDKNATTATTDKKTASKKEETPQSSKGSGTSKAVDARAASLADKGLDDAVAGVETMRAARDTASIAVEEAVIGTAELTRGMDAMLVADRLTSLSEVVSAAGANDINQGAELLATSSDIETVSAVVGLMSYG